MDIEPIKRYLSKQQQSLDDVYAEFQQIWQGLQWQPCQVRLLLSSRPKITCTNHLLQTIYQGN